MTETDVVIIGAGAAGLSAAKALRAAGIAHVVVEGSHRVGGRAYSEEIAPGIWFDLGCSYLHEGSKNPFVPIADQLGIPLNRDWADIFDEKMHYHRDGTKLSPAEVEAFDDFWEESDEAIGEAAKAREDRSIADVVDLESPFIVPYANTMAALNAKNIDEVSAADYGDFGENPFEGEGDIPVPGGFGRLVAAWGADVPVTLNARVERVDWSGSDVVVETAKGTLRARAVLVTVSTGILAANQIAFSPALPDWKQAAALGLLPGTLNKTCTVFDKDLFGPDARGFHVAWTSDGAASEVEVDVNGHPAVVTFNGGREAVWLEKQGAAAMQAKALDDIAGLFGNDIRRHAQRTIVTAWASEPWTLGAYSVAQPGQGRQREALAKPIENRLFFAGEATPRGGQCTCHGAYLSGIRAAEEIAAALSVRAARGA